MALSFNSTKGAAIKGNDSYKFKDGDNVIRLFGEIVPRYIYWVKGREGKDVPMECLSFDRNKEKFTNKEHDYVRERFPDLKCGWAYVMSGFVPGENKPLVINLKKKLFEQILTAAEDLGDPTDPVTGYDIMFKKVKTGSLAYNVEYTLQVLKLKPRALTEAELEIVNNAKPIDELVPRPTPEDQKEFLDSLNAKEDKAIPTEVQEEVDDLP